jgi:excisionase family DNA binding protein
MTTAKTWLKPEEAAEFLGVTVDTLAAWRRNGRHALPFVRSGRIVRYRLADLERWAAAHVVRPDAAADGTTRPQSDAPQTGDRHERTAALTNQLVVNGLPVQLADNSPRDTKTRTRPSA